MTPATRMALKANGVSGALDLAEIAEPLRERVIEVGLSRGKQQALWRAEVERAANLETEPTTSQRAFNT